MKKKLVPIYSVLVVAIVLLAGLAPSCGGGGGTTGTIVVQATLCGSPWPGAVNYTLTPTGGSPVNGVVVPTTHSSMNAGTWTCDYVSGGPGGAFLNSIIPSATQSLSAGGTITFTLDFELNQDAGIAFFDFTKNGQHYSGTEITADPCDTIGARFDQWVDGCDGYNVTMNETSVLTITQTAGPGGVVVHVVDDWCAVNKTPDPQHKVSQVPSFEGYPVEKGTNVTLTFLEPFPLDVKTVWQLVKGTNYTKSINWFGIQVGAYEPGLHPCVLFELILPMSGSYTFQLQASAQVALVDDTDVNPGNDYAESGLVRTLTVTVP